MIAQMRAGDGRSASVPKPAARVALSGLQKRADRDREGGQGGLEGGLRGGAAGGLCAACGKKSAHGETGREARACWRAARDELCSRKEQHSAEMKVRHANLARADLPSTGSQLKACTLFERASREAYLGGPACELFGLASRL